MSSTSKFGFRGTKRASALAVAACTLGVLVAPLGMTAASAAASADYTSLTIDSASQGTNQPAGTSAVLTINYTVAAGHLPAAIYYTVLNASGPDHSIAPSPTGASCGGVLGATSTTCTIPDTAGAVGIDQIEIFADDTLGTPQVGDAGNLLSTPPTTLVTFSDAPSSVDLQPNTAAATTDTCSLFTLNAKDSHNNQGSAQRWFDLSATELPAGTITFYDETCTFPLLLDEVQTDSAGNATFGISSDTAGSGSVKVTAQEQIPTTLPAQFATDTSTMTWAAGGPASVVSLNPSPTNVSQYINTTASFTLTALDHSGLPVQGVSVDADTTSGPDSTTDPVCLGTTDHKGQIVCTITNAATPGTDVFLMSVFGGTATTRPTATFKALPNTSTPTNFTLTCPDQTHHGAASTTGCTVPTDQHAITYTATVLDTTAAHAPIPGVVVDFTTTGSGTGTTPPTTTPVSASVTTGADGVALYTVTNSTASDGDDITVTAKIGIGFQAGPLDTNWQKRHAASIVITPKLQSVSKGGTVTFTAQESDQFGTPWTSTPDTIAPFVDGSDATLNGTAGLQPKATVNGAATFSYVSLSGAVHDTISATGSPSGTSTIFPDDTGDVYFVTGSTTASGVTVDTSGNGTSVTCPATGTPLNTNLPLGTSNTPVCAVVKNVGNETLAGKPVTFTVSNGQIDAANPTLTSTTTYTTTTNGSGIATAVVTSTTSGTQTVTATSEGVAGSGTLTYASPTLDRARNVTVSPTSAAITAGSQQTFVWTVKDRFGNPVPSATLIYTHAGAGLSGATSSGTIVTGPEGTASVIITTTSADNGAGSITATLQQPAPPSPVNQCSNLADNPVGTTAGNCTAAATYTVISASAPATIALKAASGVKKGGVETVTATVKNANGTPAVNQVVRFLVTGANGLIGSSLTNASGVATLHYTAKHAGTDAISAYLDINNDATQQGNEPGKHTKAIIAGVTEHPTIHLTSKHGSVTVHVRTHPALARDKVTYYVKRYGAFHKIGTSKTGILGAASMKFFYPKGVVRHFKAKVAGQAGILGAKTRAKKITVK